jgi:DtxR family Mn-dependent transcriptional regulator
MFGGQRRAKGTLTPSHEHYLRGIWEVRSRLGYARLADVSRELGISHATLSVGLQPLEARRLLKHDARRFLLLTARGEQIAKEVHHRYAVTRSFLQDVLGIDTKTAEAEACLLEHDLSAGTADRLVDLLRLLREDDEVRTMLKSRLAGYHRTCKSHSACSTCGLSCLTQIS